MFKKSVPLGIMALSTLSEDAKASKLTFRPPQGSVPWHNAASLSSWVKPDWNVDYFVPNFGVDKDIRSTLKHTKQAEENLKHEMHATFKPPKGHP